MRRRRRALSFEERYRRFGRVQKLAVGLAFFGSVVLVLVGLWMYSLGLILGWCGGYALGRARGYMDMAKVRFEHADQLNEIDARVKDVIEHVVTEAVEHGKRIAGSANN